MTCDCGGGPGVATRVASAAAAVVLLAAAVTAAFGPAAIVAGVVIAAVVVVCAVSPLRRAAWWLTRNGVAPLLLLTAVGVGWYVAGGAFTRRARERRKACGATYRRPGAKIAARARTGAHWYAWPGWQRTVLRLLLLAVAAAVYLAPLVTAVTLATAGSVVLGRAALLRWRAAHPRTVHAIVGSPRAEALRAVPVALTTGPIVDAELVDEPATGVRIGGRS